MTTPEYDTSAEFETFLRESVATLAADFCRTNGLPKTHKELTLLKATFHRFIFNSISGYIDDMSLSSLQYVVEHRPFLLKEYLKVTTTNEGVSVSSLKDDDPTMNLFLNIIPEVGEISHDEVNRILPDIAKEYVGKALKEGFIQQNKGMLSRKN